jgi:hypothetical protein
MMAGPAALNRLITGWVAYFRLAQRVSVLGKLDGWLRRRLRQNRWKEWKTTAAKRHNLRGGGATPPPTRFQYGSIRQRAAAGGHGGLIRFGHVPGRGSRCCTECRRDLWVLGVSQSVPSRAIM